MLIVSVKDQSVQFNRDGFVFSRLQPYQSWGSFLAMPCGCEIYLETAQTTECSASACGSSTKFKLPPKKLILKNTFSLIRAAFNLELSVLELFHHERLPCRLSLRDKHNSHDSAGHNPQTEGIGLVVTLTHLQPTF